MTIEVLLKNTETNQVFDISDLCGAITVDSYLYGQPGKLSTTCQKDPFDLFNIREGNIISLTVDGKGIFLGYAFTLGTDATQTYKVMAYDQMRYLKNEEIYITSDMTADQIFEMVCKQANLKYNVKFKNNFIVAPKVHDKVNRYAVIEYALNQTLINTEPKYNCFIRDIYGTLTFSELNAEKTGLVLGADSLLMNYRFETSIDKDTANEIKVYRNNETTGRRDTWFAIDSATQARWGTLRHMQEAPKDWNEVQIQQLAKNLLKQKNRPSKSLKLNSIGHPDIWAGSGFVLELPTLGINDYMWVTSASHTYRNDMHLMDLEVFL